MSRLILTTPDSAQNVVEGLYKDLERRIVASPTGLCPVDLSLSFLTLCHAQTCGKCVPCRVGLEQLKALLTDVLEGDAELETIDLIEKTARVIINSADCAIGYEAGKMALKAVQGFRDDFVSHIENGRCIRTFKEQAVPCVALCPAGVDIPGYIALVREGRYRDAIRLIRKDNPFPTACALVCEHPCEAKCRRNMIDDSINIKGIKRFAADNAGVVPAPECAPSTGKKVAIVGGGPGGLTAAYYLSLMGHKAVVFEKEHKLGGMLHFGIPEYRLPEARLHEDIDAILSTGVEVKYGVNIGKDVTLKELQEEYDAMFIAIGAQLDKKLNMEGEDSEGVISAVEMLHNIGLGEKPDFTGKKVAVVGGGNVAMDAARSSVRLGAENVKIVYRRRKDDMTALLEEIEGAEAEGCELVTLQAPARVEADENGKVVALWTQPQLIGKVDRGRPKPVKADLPEERLECDIVIVAIGQNIDYKDYEEFGIPTKWGNLISLDNTSIKDMPGVFTGGDCATGPSTVIKAIAAGKTAAANIDNYLGFNHTIECDVEIPEVRLEDKAPCGRVNITEKLASERKNNFEEAECGMTCEGAMQEASRCLRCDKFGYGSFRGGRTERW